ncbi:hypothetical protein OSB04_031402 [Centaurea solstitialis]|uniref:Uncharacterized protein n=1 Tax=Centaurea solstitialis TaxID=347529 RepID=A0AA38W5Y6_9ASTR|nr:hypothetical protein OSB04_031402 [Centaurea solstitialis]
MEEGHREAWVKYIVENDTQVNEMAANERYYRKICPMDKKVQKHHTMCEGYNFEPHAIVCPILNQYQHKYKLVRNYEDIITSQKGTSIDIGVDLQSLLHMVKESKDES